MMFNVLAHNRDDHTKNFAFLFTPESRWTLSPGYDLTFTEGPGGEHTTSILGEGRSPRLESMRRLAQTAGLETREIQSVYESVRDAVAHWPAFARQSGVRKSTITCLRRRLLAIKV